MPEKYIAAKIMPTQIAAIINIVKNTLNVLRCRRALRLVLV